MKKIIIAILMGVVAGACALDYTPVTGESAVVSAIPVNTPQTVTYTSTWTNGTILTPTSGIVYITASGATNTAIRTCVLAKPTVAGQSVTLIVAAGITNLPTIADSGTVALASVFTATAGDSLSLVSFDTNIWVEASRSAN